MSQETVLIPEVEAPQGMSGKLEAEAIYLAGNARRTQEFLDGANRAYVEAREPTPYSERRVPGSEKALEMHGTAVIRTIAKTRARFSSASDRATKHYQANAKEYEEQAAIDAKRKGYDINT